jgi:hypothetical protein
VADPGENAAAPGLIPGLAVRQNGFTLGTAQLIFGGRDPRASSLSTTTPNQNKIRFGSLLEFDDIRIGVNNLSQFRLRKSGRFQRLDLRGFRAEPSSSRPPGFRDHHGSHFGGRPQPDGSDNTEALRLQLTFSQGRVDSFQFSVDTLNVRSVVRHLERGRVHARYRRVRYRAVGVSFRSVGAKVKIGSLELGVKRVTLVSWRRHVRHRSTASACS